MLKTTQNKDDIHINTDMLDLVWEQEQFVFAIAKKARQNNVENNTQALPRM